MGKEDTYTYIYILYILIMYIYIILLQHYIILLQYYECINIYAYNEYLLYIHTHIFICLLYLSLTQWM